MKSPRLKKISRIVKKYFHVVYREIIYLWNGTFLIAYFSTWSIHQNHLRYFSEINFLGFHHLSTKSESEVWAWKYYLGSDTNVWWRTSHLDLDQLLHCKDKPRVRKGKWLAEGHVFLFISIYEQWMLGEGEVSDTKGCPYLREVYIFKGKKGLRHIKQLENNSIQLIFFSRRGWGQWEIRIHTQYWKIQMDTGCYIYFPCNTVWRVFAESVI